MDATTILAWWPQITALLFLVFWISRTISELKGYNDSQDERLRQIEKKIENLFELHNKEIERRLALLEKLEHEQRKI
jgi:hypothetical protein